MDHQFTPEQLEAGMRELSRFIPEEFENLIHDISGSCGWTPEEQEAMTREFRNVMKTSPKST